ncbi:bifunctional aminoglycoside phosphotransferase/ATP-binding protein [Deferrisoma palaeochoriense]
MDLEALIRALSSPEAYPHPCRRVEVRQTHISAVFLAGAYAYKIKKPLDLGFLDFSTPERRAHFCREEVRLNRRMAPEVYLGVVPVTLDRGRARVDGEGEPVEWAVWMRRLPERATLLRRLDRGEVGMGEIGSFGTFLARFHARAEAGPHVARFGRAAVVGRNARENFEQTAGHRGITVSDGVFERVRRVTEHGLSALSPLMDDRAARGVPRDTHGDLHLDHVYWFPRRAPERRWVVVDCIEFNERFRYADPVADAAFLSMDLTFQGRRDLARGFEEAYLVAAEDPEGAGLFPWYVAYRACVRAKVEGFAALEPEVSPDERNRALASARAHWLVALDALEPPERRPCLLGVGGLPGSGKSSLARGLAERLGFRLIATDVVRKELAGLSPADRAPAGYGQGIYTPEWTERTYAEVFRRAEGALFEGRRVIVDATLREARWRRALGETARAWGVRWGILLCQASEAEVRRRLSRPRKGPSDADWGVYRQARARWEPPAPGEPEPAWIVTDGPKEETFVQAVRALARWGLAPLPGP